MFDVRRWMLGVFENSGLLGTRHASVSSKLANITFIIADGDIAKMLYYVIDTSHSPFCLVHNEGVSFKSPRADAGKHFATSQSDLEHDDSPLEYITGLRSSVP